MSEFKFFHRERRYKCQLLSRILRDARICARNALCSVNYYPDFDQSSSSISAKYPHLIANANREYGNKFYCISSQKCQAFLYGRISACTSLNCVAYPGWISLLMPLISHGSEVLCRCSSSQLSYHLHLFYIAFISFRSSLISNSIGIALFSCRAVQT